MYISYLRLLNFRGIYSGMGQKELEINFPNPAKCGSKILLLMGGNGSGKSTVLSSLQPYASSFDGRDESLIRTGFNGEKEIHFINGKDKYTILHQYIRVGKNGSPLSNPSTKCFIQKNGTELNDNGGVKTFKTLVETELGIKEDFFKVGRIASTAVNFIDLPAGERKDFIIKQLPDTSEWLIAFENAKDKVNTTNKLITSLALDLEKLGEEEVLRDEYEDALNVQKELKSKVLDAEKSKAVLDKQIEDFNNDPEKMEMVHNIERAKEIEAENESLRDNSISIRTKLKRENPEDLSEFTSKQLDAKYESLREKQADFDKKVDGTETALNEISSKKTEAYSKLNELKKRKTEITKFDANMEELVEQKTECESKLKEVKAQMDEVSKKLHFDKYKYTNEVLEMERREFSGLAALFGRVLEKLNPYFYDPNGNVRENLNTIVKENGDDAEKFIQELIKSRDQRLKQVTKELEETKDELIKAQNELDISSRLDGKVPSECNITTCVFRKGFLTPEGKRISTRRRDNLEKQVTETEEKIKKINDSIELYQESGKILDDIMMAKKMLDKSGLKYVCYSFLRPSESLRDFFDVISEVTQQDIFASFRKWYDSFDTYREGVLISADEEKKLENINSKIQYLKNNQSFMKSLDKDISETETTLSSLEEEFKERHEQLILHRQKLQAYGKSVALVNNYREYMKEIESNTIELQQLKKSIGKFEKQAEKFKKWQEQVEEFTKVLEELNAQLDRQNKLVMQYYTKITNLEEMKKKLSELRENYTKQVIIRDTADPKKGYPLIYLRTYMREIEELSNDLFEIAFGKDKFYISFDIDEKVFKVNIYKADGDVLEDAKLASDGERSLVKLIISLALMSRDTNFFPIMSLDEVDAVLDDQYRGSFANIIEGQIKALGLNQVFIISHNENFRNSSIPVCLFPRNTFNHKVEGNLIVFDYNNRK